MATVKHRIVNFQRWNNFQTMQQVPQSWKKRTPYLALIAAESPHHEVSACALHHGRTCSGEQDWVSRETKNLCLNQEKTISATTSAPISWLSSSLIFSRDEK